MRTGSYDIELFVYGNGDFWFVCSRQTGTDKEPIEFEYNKTSFPTMERAADFIIAHIAKYRDTNDWRLRYAPIPSEAIKIMSIYTDVCIFI